MAGNQNPDRNPASRDTVKQPAFTADPNAGRVGAMASMGQASNANPQPTAMGANGDPNNPNTPNSMATGSLGAMASPPVYGTEAPAQSTDEQNARVQRNVAFLQDPTTRAQLMQFSLSMLGAAGRGNPIGGISSAIADAQGLPGRLKEMNLKAADTMQQMNIRERSQQVEESKLRLDELRFMREGGMKFGRVITSDDPLNQKFGLGIPQGGTARVEFTADANGNIKGASVESPYGDQPKTSEITQLRSQADALDQKGDTQGAALLRQRADTIATGANPTKAGGVGIPDKTSPTGYKIGNVPGSEADIAAQDAAAQAKSKEEAQQQQANLVIQRIDKASDMLKNSVAPNVFVSGWGDYLKYLPASEAADFAETISTIKANNTVNQLSKMRADSKSGASGLGQVTEFEDKMLAAVTGSLEQKQSSDQMLQNLATVKQVYNAIINTGALSDIGKQVDAGTISEQEGLQQAAALLAPTGSETQSGMENGKEPIPFPEHVTNLTADQAARAKAAWPFMQDADKKKFITDSTGQ